MIEEYHIQEKIEEGQLEIAKRMLAKGMETALIAELTGLPETTIITLTSEPES
jgi:predicted transposase YdaD